jgi:hypothetical protein
MRNKKNTRLAASQFAINSSSAFGQTILDVVSLQTDWNLLSPFWRARIFPCHYEFQKNHVWIGIQKLDFERWGSK